MPCASVMLLRLSTRTAARHHTSSRLAMGRGPKSSHLILSGLSSAVLDAPHRRLVMHKSTCSLPWPEWKWRSPELWTCGGHFSGGRAGRGTRPLTPAVWIVTMHKEPLEVCPGPRSFWLRHRLVTTPWNSQHVRQRLADERVNLNWASEQEHQGVLQTAFLP
jgi:hypothetical protein